MTDRWHPYIPLPYDPEYEPDCDPGPNWGALGLWAFGGAVVAGIAVAIGWHVGVL